MKGLMDIGRYAQMTAEHAWNRYNWGFMKGGSTVYRYEEERLRVMVGIDRDNVWWCEVEAKDGEGEYVSYWGMVGQGWGDTREDAMLLAITEMLAMDVMRKEGNPEDAVNVLADEVYEIAYGPAPFPERDMELYGGIWQSVKRYVEENCYKAGFEWEEF